LAQGFLGLEAQVRRFFGEVMSNVIPQDFIKHEVENEGDWSEWVNPKSEQYFMKCCDCGLVHEMQFKVAKYSEGDECEFVADSDLQAVFRARRATPPEKRQWTDIDIDRLSVLAGFDPAHKVELGLVRSVVRTILRKKTK
jgi:hypothetical protein